MSTHSGVPYALVKLYRNFSSVLGILGYSETSVHFYQSIEGLIQEDNNVFCERVSVTVIIWNCILEVLISNLRQIFGNF
jgi:hypothetical protein